MTKKKQSKSTSPELEATPATVSATEIESPVSELAAAKIVSPVVSEDDASHTSIVASESIEAAASDADEEPLEDEEEDFDDEDVAEEDEESDESDEEDEEDAEDEEDDSDEDEEDEDLEEIDEDAEEDEDDDEEDDEEDADEDGEVDNSKHEPAFKSKPRPPAKIERLQKILAQAGVASRRKAEEMIEQGRVQVNGKTVTELGTKADAGRDHIRVDGKLLQGAERLRYYVLNKPKGFVTTVKDPEGRPTVMQFFDKMRERLYPVGRLDYMSEGLLLVTNDGELANRLTKAASGVEKTYLVKVAGQPTEDELDALRAGVSIERGKPGSPKVRTSPARIRQVRQGDNPWFEVVLIEGRNRELRKMFEEVGHFVEKIRRIGYGPLVLDQEPGNLRELDEQELAKLRLAAEGKLRTPKSKEVRRRNAMDSQLPTVEPTNRPAASRPFGQRPAAAGDYRTKRSFEEKKPFGSSRPVSSSRPEADRSVRSSGEGYRPSAGRPAERRTGAPSRPGSFGPSKFGSDRPAGRPAARPAWQKDSNPRFEAPRGEGRPPVEKPYNRPTASSINGESAISKPYNDRPAGKTYGDRPARSFGDKPRTFGDRPAGRNFGGKPFGDKPAKSWSKPGGNDRSDYKRPALSTRADDDYSDLEPRKPVKIFIEPIQPSERSSRPSSPRSISDRPYSARSGAPRSNSSRPYSDRSGSDRSGSDRSSAPRSYSDRPRTDRPAPSRPSADRPSYDRSSQDRSSQDRPARSEGGMERRFTTSSGQPRAGGARPSSKPGRSFGAGAGRSSGPRTGGRPDSRPSFGGKPGGSSRPSFGQSRPSFRRDEGSSSAPRPSAPRSESTSDFRPTAAKPYPNSASRAERKAGSDWKPKTRFGGTGKPSSGGSRPGGFSKSGPKGGGFKGKPAGKKRY